MMRFRHKILYFSGVLLTLGLLAAVSSSSVQAAAQSIVTDVRAGIHERNTRMVLDLTQGIDYQVFTLDKPYRVVVDMPEVGWRLPPKALPSRIGVLNSLRYGLYKPGISRLVLDMNGPISISQSLMLKPSPKAVPGTARYRLVLDLAPVSRAAFLSALKRGKRTVQSSPRKIFKTFASKTTKTLAPKTRASKTKTLALKSPAAKPRPPLRPANKPVKKARKRLIIIDPGHGGVDPGTIGVSGTYEKNVTLAAARDFKKHLEQTGRYRVKLTRNRDIFVRLRKRVVTARDAGADLFVSVHADATPNRATRGLSVYTLSEKASDKEAAALADKENKSDLIAGIDLTHESPVVTNILIDLAQRESMNQSSNFASGLVNALKREINLLRNTHRFAGFAVLKAPDIPSVLIELGFLSNRQDERALLDRRYRAKLARALVRGVDAYFNQIEEARRR